MLGRVGEPEVLVPAREVEGDCLNLRLPPYVTFTALLGVEGSPNDTSPTCSVSDDAGMGELSSCSAVLREAFWEATRRDMLVLRCTPRSTLAARYTRRFGVFRRLRSRRRKFDGAPGVQ